MIVGGVVLWVAVSFDAAETLWLATMVVASTTLVVLLVGASRDLGERRAVVAYVVHLVLTFGLAGLARVPEQTWTLQWVEQLSNTVSQGLFLLASKGVFEAATAPPARFRDDEVAHRRGRALTRTTENV